MDSLMHTRSLKRVTEGSHWKESKQVPFPMISVLRTACSSNAFLYSRNWKGTESLRNGTQRKMQHIGSLKVERPLTSYLFSCCPNGLGTSDENEDNMKSSAMGHRTCGLCWTEVQSPLWVQLLFLIAHYKTFSDLTQDTTLTYRSSCFHPRLLPSGLISGTISKCIGSIHAWCHPGVPRSMLSWSRSYSLLGLALGFVTRRLF